VLKELLAYGGKADSYKSYHPVRFNGNISLRNYLNSLFLPVNG